MVKTIKESVNPQDVEGELKKVLETLRNIEELPEDKSSWRECLEVLLKIADRSFEIAEAQENLSNNTDEDNEFVISILDKMVGV